MIFKLALNTTPTIQTFITKSSKPITVHQHQALETSQIHGGTNHVLIPIGSFLKILDEKKIKRFYIIRTYAMGDMLMLVPVVRALRKRGYDPYLRIAKIWKPMFDLFDDIETEITKQAPRSTDWGINLDGILEQDHSRPILSKIHRVEIYFMALGAKKVPKSLDWGLNLEKLPKANVGVEGDYICFQEAGSNKTKQLPLDSINYVKERLKEKGINVIMISKENRKSIEELFALIAGAKMLITMDSAPLWISHFTKTPIIALLGPTRASERLSKHPLYPKKAVGVALNEEINCESCFQTAEKCDGRVDCLRISSERIFELIEPHVLKFWKK